MNDYPKPIKRALRQLSARAYEVELGRALNDLRAQFTRWENGEIDAFDLDDAIHEYHQHTSRELYNRYRHSNPLLGPTVAFAITNGLLDRNEIDPEVLSHIVRELSFYEATK